MLRLRTMVLKAASVEHVFQSGLPNGEDAVKEGRMSEPKMSSQSHRNMCLLKKTDELIGAGYVIWECIANRRRFPKKLLRTVAYLRAMRGFHCLRSPPVCVPRRIRESLRSRIRTGHTGVSLPTLRFGIGVQKSVKRELHDTRRRRRFW